MNVAKDSSAKFLLQQEEQIFGFSHSFVGAILRRFSLRNSYCSVIVPRFWLDPAITSTLSVTNESPVVSLTLTVKTPSGKKANLKEPFVVSTIDEVKVYIPIIAYAIAEF